MKKEHFFTGDSKKYTHVTKYFKENSLLEA